MITDDNYYTSLNILDRIDEIRIKKGISTSEFCRNLEKSTAWWTVIYSGARVIRFQTLCKIAKILNLSVIYLITGKNKGKYKRCYIDREEIKKLKGKIYYAPNRLHTIVSYFRKNYQQDVSVKTLLDISYYYKIDITNLIKEDKMYFEEYVKIHENIFPQATSESQLKKFCEEYREFGEAEEHNNFMEEWGDSLFVAVSLQRFKESENLAELLIDNLYHRYSEIEQKKIKKYLDKAVKKVQSRTYTFVNGEYVREK